MHRVDYQGDLYVKLRFLIFYCRCDAIDCNWNFNRSLSSLVLMSSQIGSLTSIKARSPIIAGNFAVWGGMFSVSLESTTLNLRFECCMNFFLSHRKTVYVPLLDYRLHTRSLPTEGRSLEFNHQRRSYRRNSRSKTRSRRNGWQCSYWWRSFSFNRRCWHSLHTFVGRSVQKSITTRRTTTRSISAWWCKQKLVVAF